MKLHLRFSICLTIVAAAGVSAATPLFDFEQDADVAAWHWASRGPSKLERGVRFATAGQSSLCFTTAAWQKGQPEWPAFQIQPPVTNWSGYDRLVVDVTNPHEERYLLGLFVSDRKVPFRQGLSFKFDLPSRGYRRFVVPLSLFPKTVNRADISVMHFFTERPQTDLALYLDNITLLKPHESLPEPGPKFAQQLTKLKLDQIAAAERLLSAERKAVTSSAVGGQFASLAQRLQQARTQLTASVPSMAQLNALTEELSGLPEKTERLRSIAQFEQACRAAGQTSDEMLVGMATSMEKNLAAWCADSRPTGSRPASQFGPKREGEFPSVGPARVTRVAEGHGERE